MPVATGDGITEPQKKLIFDLATERIVTADQESWLEENVAGLSKVKASEVITRMLKLPKRPEPSVNSMWANVPEGRYAVEDPDDGVLKFYHVDRPTEGRWAGYLFLNVRASDDRYPIRDKDHKARIMDEIAKDPRQASITFGLEIGECGVCGRTLTNEESRRYGIGPICRGKTGW